MEAIGLTGAASETTLTTTASGRDPVACRAFGPRPRPVASSAAAAEDAMVRGRGPKRVRRYAKLGAVKVWDREGRALMAALYLHLQVLTGQNQHAKAHAKARPARKSSSFCVLVKFADPIHFSRGST